MAEAKARRAEEAVAMAMPENDKQRYWLWLHGWQALPTPRRHDTRVGYLYVLLSSVPLK